MWTTQITIVTPHILESTDVQKNTGSIFVRRFSSLSSLGCILCHCLIPCCVPICTFLHPLSRADSVPSAWRNRETIPYRRRCQLPHLMLFHPDSYCELCIGTVICIGVYMYIPSTLKYGGNLRSSRVSHCVGEYPRNLRYSFRSFS